MASQSIGPAHFLLVFGTARRVEEPARPLAPVALEREPGVGVPGPGRIAHEPGLRRHPPRRAGRVVAAEALARAAPQPEVRREVVRVRSRGRVDDRVGAVPLERAAVPGRALAAVVLRVADRDRLLPQRLSRRVGREDELDHLPVALVQVVELVEVVEEPVLQREAPRDAGLGHDVRVGDGRVALAERDGVAGVGAAGLVGVARVVEEPVRVLAVEVGRGRGRDRRPVPVPVRRAPQDDLRAVQHDLHRRRHVLLAGGVARRGRLSLQLQDRREPVGQQLGGRRSGSGRRRERQQQAEGQQQAPG